MQLKLDDHFNIELPGDAETANRRRQVSGAAFSLVTPRAPSNPQLLHVALDVADYRLKVLRTCGRQNF